ncbi:MAG: hypothetical protein HYT87_20235 [Nitrospirae bacterium]|nr:hypothetical protein [Nitrospirota bacterium]
MRHYTWIPRAADIAFELMKVPALLDRKDVEKLFKIPKTSAVYLMRAAGGEKKGISMVISRDRLTAFVNGKVNGEPSRRPALGEYVIEGEPLKEDEWLEKVANGVRIAAKSRAEFVRNLKRLTQALQDPIEREKMFRELHLQ